MTTRIDSEWVLKDWWEGQGSGLYDRSVDQLLEKAKVYSLLDLIHKA